MESPAPLHVVVTDTNILINLIHCRQLGLLRNLPGYRFVVPREVLNELRIPEQRKMVEEALNVSDNGAFIVEDVGASELIATLRSQLGSADAACIGLAVAKGWMLASDDKRRFNRLAREYLAAC